jgi:hypothetical protein
LRAAGGQVRCGRCGQVFNALQRLAEDASAFPSGESPLEMEARADEILHSPMLPATGPTTWSEVPADDLGAADTEFARLQIVETFQEPPAAPVERRDATASSAKRAETARVAPTAKPAPAAKAPEAAKSAPASPAAADPGKIGEAAKTAVKPAASAVPAAPTVKPTAKAAPATKPASAAKPAQTAKPASAAKPTEPAASADNSTDDSSMEFTLPPGELDRVFVDPVARPRGSPLGAADAHAALNEASEDPAGEMVDVGRLAGLEVSEEARREMLAGIRERSLGEALAPATRLPLALWLGAAIVLTLLLGAQMIHENREWLAAHAPLRGPLHALYAALGIAVQVPANLSAYQLRQWGVTGEPSAAGTLRVRASILNTAAQLQPYPLLRVTLANRFGARIGARDFEPTEYLGKPTVRMLEPGERADATLDILDPGKDAEGFEIDVCLRGLGQKVSCAGDAAAQTKQ